MSICWPKASVTFCSNSLIFSGFGNGMILEYREVTGQKKKTVSYRAESFRSSGSESQREMRVYRLIHQHGYNTPKTGLERMKSLFSIMCILWFIFDDHERNLSIGHYDSVSIVTGGKKIDRSAGSRREVCCVAMMLTRHKSMQWKQNKNRTNRCDVKVSAYLQYVSVYESVCASPGLSPCL